MNKIQALNNLWIKTFQSKRYFILFPFFFVALAVSIPFYIVSVIYMFFDLAYLEIKKEIYDNENVNGLAQFVKFAMFYSVVFAFYLVKTILLGVLAIVYFLISVCIFISSLGYVKVNCFEFHNL